jgi:hypothetical protein
MHVAVRHEAVPPEELLPDNDSCPGIYTIVFALLLTGIAGVTVYVTSKEGQRERSVESRS